MYKRQVRRGTAELHAALGERSAEVVVDLITVSVSLMDLLSTVYLVCLGGLVQNTRIRTKDVYKRQILSGALTVISFKALTQSKILPFGMSEAVFTFAIG